jgi:hypothetical protein
MNLGQTMISALALLLLTVLVLNANRLIVRSGDDMMKAEALDAAVTLAQSLLEEIQTKRFDVGATDYPKDSVSSFTAPGSLGPLWSERSQINPWPDQEPFKSIGRGEPPSGNKGYNDVDDYHGYERTASMSGIAGFRLYVQVYYVTHTNPDVNAGTRTYYKRADVTVTHPTYIPSDRPVRLSSIIAY